MRSDGDLSVRNARKARLFAYVALTCDLLAIAPILLVRVAGPFVFWLSLFAVIGLAVSILGLVYAHRCLSPRPSGPFFTLLLSLAIIGGYAFLMYALASLARMH